MEKAIEFHAGGIKCDFCNYKDETVILKDYGQWLNKPCPVCGSNLLTEADYKNIRLLLKMAEMANTIIPPSPDDEEAVGITVKMDGTGKMEFERKTLGEEGEDRHDNRKN